MGKSWTFGDLRSAVQRVASSPAEIDAVVWLVLHAPDLHERAQWLDYASSSLQALEHGSVSMGDLVRWCAQAEPWLWSRLRQESADALSLTREDVADWLTGLSWLLAVTRGQGHALLSEDYDCNWLCRGRPGSPIFDGLGLVLDGYDSEQWTLWPQLVHAQSDSVGQDGRFLMRICQTGDGQVWPGLSRRLGVAHAWRACAFEPEDVLGELDDELME